MASLPGIPTEADWQALAKLLAGAQAAFRHRLGVSKGSVHGFYGPTSEAAVIRARKSVGSVEAPSTRESI